jgi:tetratricopeptide (TPR) repeat protein
MRLEMKPRTKSKFRRLTEVVVMLSVTAVSALLFQHQQTADKVDEATLRKTEAVVQDGAERSKELVKNGPRYFVAGLKALYNPAADIKYSKLDIYDEALRSSPDNSELLDRRLDLLIKLQEYDRAVEDLSRLMALRPDQHGYYYTRGWVYEQQGHLPAARKDLEHFLAVDEDEDGFGSNVYANILAGQGLFEEALFQAEKAVAKQERLGSYGSLGFTLVGLERYEEAIEAYSRALEFDPRHPYVLRGRAVAYRHTGQLEKSESDLTAQVAVDPDFCYHWKCDFDPGQHDSENKGVLTSNIARQK